jgi:hypothetical protein
VLGFVLEPIIFDTGRRAGLKIQKLPILFGYFSLNANRVFRGKITFLVAITVHLKGSPEEGRK